MLKSFVLPALLLLSACAASGTDSAATDAALIAQFEARAAAPAAEGAARGPFVYRCAGAAAPVTVVFTDDPVSAAVVDTGRGPTPLPQQVSASGARYGDGETEFWAKGDAAWLTQADRPAARCETVSSP